MDKQQLTTYIEYVANLEKQLFIQNAVIQQLRTRANSLGHRKQFIQPKISEKKSRFILIITVGFICGLISLITCIVSCSFSDSSVWRTLEEWDVLIIAAICNVCGAIITAVISRIIDTRKVKSRYSSEMYLYENAVKHDDERMKREIQEKNIIINECQLLENQRSKTRAVLNRFYSVNVIYEKYRSLIPIAMFLDYFKSGRCSTLEEKYGGDGAYNIYEQERRLDRIIDSLEKINKNLELIRSNQYFLYCAMKEGNKTIQQLVNSTQNIAAAQNRIAGASAVTAYNAQRSADELTQIKWLNYYFGVTNHNNNY